MSNTNNSSQQTLLYSFDAPLSEAVIISRPSKIIKSPFVSDISINQENEENKNLLGHCPSLGCSGLAEKNSIVLCSKLEGEKTKCHYRVELSIFREKGQEIIIGTAPKLAEYITFNALNNNLVQGLIASNIEREKKMLNSRFDFMGNDENGIKFILEVKTVPLATYANVDPKIYKKMDFSNIDPNNKIAYFPDGYRKNKNEPVSERAIKHVIELAQIKKEQGSNVRCILLFVIQRTDITSFQPSRLDTHYLEAIRNAHKDGVEIKTIVVKWTRDGKCHFHKNDLPIHLYDE